MPAPSRLARALGAVVLLFGTLLVSAAAPASASIGPAIVMATDIQALGMGSLDIAPTTAGFDVCGLGIIRSSVHVAGLWTLTASLVGGIPVMSTSPSLTFDHCVTVPYGALPAGVLVADFSYVGVGTGILVHSIGGGTFAPVVGAQTFATDLTPYSS